MWNINFWHVVFHFDAIHRSSWVWVFCWLLWCRFWLKAFPYSLHKAFYLCVFWNPVLGLKTARKLSHIHYNHKASQLYDFSHTVREELWEKAFSHILHSWILICKGSDVQWKKAFSTFITFVGFHSSVNILMLYEVPLLAKIC